MACNGTSLETHRYALLNASLGVDPGAPTPPAPLRMSLAVIMALMVVVGFLGNAVVCVIVYQRPAMRSAINLLLATLAFSDIMLSVCCMPFTAVTLITVRWRFGDHFCRLSAALYWFFVLEGVAVLLIISVDHSVYSLLSVFSRGFYCGPSFYATSSCVLWLSYLKSVFNPIVYCWRIKKFREACLELLPQTFQILPKVPERIRRKIQPSTVYVCAENQSAV
nr:probable G-protein coupled receptor 45 [Vicugna pacos]